MTEMQIRKKSIRELADGQPGVRRHLLQVRKEENDKGYHGVKGRK